MNTFAWRPSWLLWALLAALAAVGGAFLARSLGGGEPRVALVSGTWLPEPRVLRDFTLTDAEGRAFGLAQLRGAPTMVFFGFTHCPDVCPATLAQLALVRQSVPGLRVVFVSVDPGRDTPELLGRYARAFDPEFIAVTGAQDVLEGLERNLAVASARVPLPDGSYTVDHSAALYLIDEHGRWVAVFTPPFAAAKLAADLRTAIGAMS